MIFLWTKGNVINMVSLSFIGCLKIEKCEQHSEEAMNNTCMASSICLAEKIVS